MDTVVRDPFREAWQAGSAGRPLSDVIAGRDPDAWPRFERGEWTEQQYFDSHRTVRVDVEKFHAARRAGYAWLPGMAELLDELEGVAIRVAASNYPVWIEELTATILAGRFDLVVASHHLRVRKPEAEFYEGLLERLRLDADEVVFVDDREDNVRGALAVGMRAHLFVGAEDLRERLRLEGIAVAP